MHRDVARLANEEPAAGRCGSERGDGGARERERDDDGARDEANRVVSIEDEDDDEEWPCSQKHDKSAK